METREGRWVDGDGNKLREHRHDHYDWHFMRTKHRPLTLSVTYPEVSRMMRSAPLLRLKIFSPRLADQLIEKYNIDKIGATVDKRGGQIEIYLEKLFEDLVELGREHFQYDILNDAWHNEGIRALASIALFDFFHDCYYIHEILHRMWQWESSHRENKRRDRVKEEDIVNTISRAISTQLHNHLFEADLDYSWEHYRKMLKESKDEIR